MKNNRINRVDSEIQKHLASIISKFDDSDFTNALISIMKVETYADLSMSKIYVSVFGNDEFRKKIVKKLNDNKKTIRYELANKLRLRITPDLLFVLDEVEQKAERVMKLFKEIESDSNINE